MTASRSVFDGIVPVLTQTPPTMCRRSTTADALAELRALDRGLLAGRAGSDHEEVVVEAHRAGHATILHDCGRECLTRPSTT